jgi:hypothetical protein
MNSSHDDQASKPGEELGEETLADMKSDTPVNAADKAAEASGQPTGKERRKALRERVAEKASRIAAAQFDQACEMAIELRHKRGCPEEDALPGEADRRVEFHSATKPRTNDEPQRPMLVVRCIECGEEEVAPDESEKS